MMKFTARSTRPPKYPAVTPSVVPIAPAVSMTNTPMISEMRAPNSSRLK